MSQSLSNFLTKTKHLLHRRHRRHRPHHNDDNNGSHGGGSGNAASSRRKSIVRGSGSDNRISLIELSETLMQLKATTTLLPGPPLAASQEEVVAAEDQDQEKKSGEKDGAVVVAVGDGDADVAAPEMEIVVEKAVGEDSADDEQVVDIQNDHHENSMFTSEEVAQLQNLHQRTLILHQLCALGDVQRLHHALTMVYATTDQVGGKGEMTGGSDDLVPPEEFLLDVHVQVTRRNRFTLASEPSLAEGDGGKGTATETAVRISGSLMHTAAQFDKTEVMEYLARARVKGANSEQGPGAKIDSTAAAAWRVEDEHNATPLFLAVMRDAVDAVLLILHLDAQNQVHHVDHKGNTALHYAVQKHYFETVKHLLLFGADINAKGYSGYTPLLQACEHGDKVAVDFLLQNNASIMRTSQNRENVLMVACGYPSLVDHLLRSVQDEKQSYQLLTGRNDRDMTLIHMCAEYGMTRTLIVISYYLSRMLSTSTGQTAEKGSLLREMVNAKGHRRMQLTPLHIAVMSNQLAMVRMLCMSIEVDVDVKNTAGDTALHVAIRQKKLDMVRILVTIGHAKMNIKNAQKNTAKQLAKVLDIPLVFKASVESDDDDDDDNDADNAETSSEENGKLNKLAALLFGKRKEFVAARQRIAEERRRKSEMQLRAYARARRLSKQDARSDTAAPQSSRRSLSLEPQDGEVGKDILPWGPNLCVGEHSIDEEHRQLVDLINLLYKHTMSKSSDWTLLYVLGAVLEYTEYHFGNEEKKMHKYKYPRMTEHIAQHRDFTNKVREAHNRFLENANAGKSISDSGAIELDLLNFLSNWLHNHILNVDRYLSNWIREHGGGHSDDENETGEGSTEATTTATDFSDDETETKTHLYLSIKDEK